MGQFTHHVGPRGPRFACTFNAQNFSAAQDLFEIVAPSNSEVRIREIKLGQYTDFGDAKSDLVSILVMTGHTSAGSGGTAITPAKLGRRTGSSVVAASTVKRNNTTQASGGTLTLLADVWNIMAGFLYAPSEEDEMIYIKAGERCVISNTALTDSLNVNATVIIEEVGRGTPA
jgi:hypothetical protein